MNIKKIILIILISIFLTGCTKINEKDIVQTSIELTEVSEDGSIIYQNDNIKIKISNKVENPEDIYKKILNELQIIEKFSKIGNLEIQISKQYIVPNIDKIIKCDTKFIETEEFKKELIKKSYGIYDNWISEGLYARIYDIEEKEVDFTTYYSNNDFSLFGARFFEPFSTKEEVDNIKAASIDLVEYILKNNKKEELLKNNINISDIEEWAKEKGIDLSYQREIESLMNRMEVYDIEDKFIINTREEINGFKIDINIAEIKAQYSIAEQYNTAEKLEQIILRFDRDILALKKGIEKDAPRFYSEYKQILNNVPKIEYIFDTSADGNADGGYIMAGTEEIHLRDLNVHAHEYCHLLFHNPFIEEGIVITKPVWLNEGIADYLYGVYSEAYIEVMEYNFYKISNFMEVLGTLNLMDNELKELQSLYTNLLNIYIENNIDINNIEEIAKNQNKRIIENHLRYLSRVKFNQILGSKLNDGSASLDLMNEGNTMDYHKNFSFVNYLIQEYGLEKILYLNVADFSQLTYKETFGKTFDELKIDWMNYLKENIKGIESIF